MKSRNYAGISLLASLAACNSATAETVQKNSTQAPQKPNVIVILADDLGYGDLKCYGAKNVETPMLTNWHRKAFVSLMHIP